MDGDISTEQETWHVYNFGKRNVFRLDLNESREGFFVGKEGEGHSMLVDRTQKRRKNQQSGVRNLEAESGECFCDCLQAERRVFL